MIDSSLIKEIYVLQSKLFMAFRRLTWMPTSIKPLLWQPIIYKHVHYLNGVPINLDFYCSNLSSKEIQRLLTLSSNLSSALTGRLSNLQLIEGHQNSAN